MSTVEILEIPPCFAAVLILASSSKAKPHTTVAEDLPTLEPTELLVAVTGIVIEQAVNDNAANATKAPFDNFFFVIIINLIRFRR